MVKCEKVKDITCFKSVERIHTTVVESRDTEYQ